MIPAARPVLSAEPTAFSKALPWLVAFVLFALAGAARSADAPVEASGATLFAQNCSACHQLTGKGIAGAFPALAGDVFVQGPPDKVATLLLNGRGGMPSFRADLDDQQIGAILTYVRSAWGNHAAPIEPATVSKVRGPQAADRAAQPLQAH
jgi:mono/diheme cytochrome c family protein